MLGEVRVKVPMILINLNRCVGFVKGNFLGRDRKQSDSELDDKQFTTSLRDTHVSILYTLPYLLSYYVGIYIFIKTYFYINYEMLRTALWKIFYTRKVRLPFSILNGNFNKITSCTACEFTRLKLTCTWSYFICNNTLFSTVLRAENPYEIN